MVNEANIKIEQYDEDPEIWKVWHIYEDAYRSSMDKATNPTYRLLVKRENNFYPNDLNAYFDVGYKYFFGSGIGTEYVQLTLEEFQSKSQEFKYRRDGRGGLRYTCKLAYEKMPKPKLPSNPTFEDYNKYLRVYYPEYIADDVGAAFALWTETGEPVVLVRLKCGCEHEWDMVYPGEKDFVPLWNFSWRELDNFGDRFGEAEQIYPQELFGSCIGKPKEHVYACWGGNRPRRIDNVNVSLGGRPISYLDFWDGVFGRG